MDGDRLADVLVMRANASVSYFGHYPNFSKHATSGELPVDHELLSAAAVWSVDFDRDGHSDLLVGTEDGHVLFLKRTGLDTDLGHFRVARLHGVNVSAMARPCAVDWDDDGDVDLIVGSGDGSLHYFERLADGALAELPRDRSPLPYIAGRGAVAPVALDWDGDGDLDLILAFNSTAAGPKYFERSESGLLFERTGSANPFAAPTFLAPFPILAADLDGDGDYDVATRVSAVDGSPVWLLYRRELGDFAWDAGGESMSLVSGGNGVDFLFSGGRPFVIDWDRDGTLELMLSGVSRAIYFVHWDLWLGTMVQAPRNPLLQHLETLWPWITVTPTDWDHDGDIDLIVSRIGPDGLCRLVYFERTDPSTDDIVERSGADNPFGRISFRSAVAYPTVVDWDGDGDNDIVVGLDSRLVYFEQREGGVLEDRTVGSGFEDVSPGDTSLTPWVADWNGDKQLDLILGGDSGAIHYYKRESSSPEQAGGRSWRLVQQLGDSNPFDGMVFQGRSIPCVADWDGDGDDDLVVGTEIMLYYLSRGYCKGHSCFGGRCLRGGSSPREMVCACVDGGTGSDCSFCEGHWFSTPRESSYTDIEPKTCKRCPGVGVCSAHGTCWDDPAARVVAMRQSPSLGLAALGNGSCVCGDNYFGADCAEGGCPVGTEAIGPSNICRDCPAGKYRDSTLRSCTACPPGNFAFFTGASSCSPPYNSLVVWFIAALAAVVNAAFLWVHAVGLMLECEKCPCGRRITLRGRPFNIHDTDWKRIPMQELTDGCLGPESLTCTERLVVELTERHRMSGLFGGEIHVEVWGLLGGELRAEISGTGNRVIDETRYFRMRPVANQRNVLELLDANGKPFAEPLHTSSGIIRFSVMAMLLRYAALPRLVATCMFCVWSAGLWYWYLNKDMFEGRHFSLQLLATIVVALAGPAFRRRPRRGILVRKLELYRRNLRAWCPDPEPTARGPLRGLELEKILDLHNHFTEFIRDRNMYYLEPNIIHPLTAPYALSYAEVAGPSPAQWFVSHYWGTALRYTLDALRRHAEALDPDGPWMKAAYWICTFSINQYKLAPELGHGVAKESSFYKALTSDKCRGTCMVVDRSAMPLTRSWCLFELLQTFELQDEAKRTGKQFKGLLLCTSTGELTSGEASVEVSMGIARHLSRFSLRKATASTQEDQDMIVKLIKEQKGGFDRVERLLYQRLSEALDRAREVAERDFKDVKDLVSKAIYERQTTFMIPVSLEEISVQVEPATPVSEASEDGSSPRISASRVAANPRNSRAVSAGCGCVFGRTTRMLFW